MNDSFVSQRWASTLAGFAIVFVGAISIMACLGYAMSATHPGEEAFTQTVGYGGCLLATGATVYILIFINKIQELLGMQ